MLYLTYSLAFLLFSCSTVLVISDIGFRNEHSLSTESDTEFMPKEPYTSDNDLGGDGKDSYTESMNSETDQSHDRLRREAIFSDIGYGSRLTAGSNLANDYYALHSVFGQEGPGKRASERMIHDIKRPYVPSLVWIKRDHGYGSRVRAGSKFADSVLARNSLFGKHGPGRKRSENAMNYEFLRGELQPLAVNAAGNNRKMEQLVTDNIDMLTSTDELSGDGSIPINDSDEDIYETPKRRVYTDSGYGSRINAAANIARDVAAIDAVFGIYGPGR